MRDIVIDLNNIDTNLYYTSVIRQGEHNASQLLITLSDEFIGYTYKLSFKLNDNGVFLTNDVVPVNGVITYVLSNALTQEFGTLKVELHAYEYDLYLAKSVIIPLKIQSALEGIPIELPAEYETYIQVVEHYMDKDIYDPQGIQADAFSMDNMVETPTKKVFTSEERQKLAILAGGQPNVEYIDFSSMPVGDGFTKGRMQWSEDNSTITIGLGEVKIEVNQAQFFKAKNVGVATLNVGQVVYIVGSDGEQPTVSIADANGTEQESYAVAVTAIQPVLSGEFGYFLTSGLLHKVDTLGFAEGDPLWLSNTNGLPTNVRPTLPSVPVFLGWCVKQANADSGMIYVNITRYPSADKVPTLDAGDYFTSNSVEENLQEIGAKTKTAFGEIYVYNGATPQAIPNGLAYTKITPFMANGEALNCTPDAPNQRIVIARNGKYRVTSTFSSESSVNNTIMDTALFLNGVEVQKAHIVRQSSAGQPSAGSMTCILTCVVGDILDVRVKHDKLTPINLTVRYGNLNVTKIVG